jgi:hypothetical protein
MLWNDWRVRFTVNILAVFCFPPAIFGQATGRAWSSTSAFTFVHPIFELSLLVLSIAAAIFVVVFCFDRLLRYEVQNGKRQSRATSFRRKQSERTRIDGYSLFHTCRFLLATG